MEVMDGRRRACWFYARNLGAGGVGAPRSAIGLVEWVPFLGARISRAMEYPKDATLQECGVGQPAVGSRSRYVREVSRSLAGRSIIRGKRPNAPVVFEAAATPHNEKRRDRARVRGRRQRWLCGCVEGKIPTTYAYRAVGNAEGAISGAPRGVGGLEIASRFARNTDGTPQRTYLWGSSKRRTLLRDAKRSKWR